MGTLHVYNVYTFEENLEIKFKFGKMQHFVWLNHDQFIVSCSNSGNVCVWNVLTGERLYEYIEKRTCFLYLTAVLNESILHIIALDRMNNIRVLKIKSDKSFCSELDGVIEDLEVSQLIETKKTFTQNEKIICFQAFKNLIFFGDSKGKVYMLDLNSEKLLPSEKTSHLFHNSSICQLFLLEKNGRPYLISCSVNGLIILSSLTKEILAKGSKSLHNEWIDDVLITKNEIVKNLKYDRTLKETLFEQESEQKNKINLTEIIHKKEIKEINYDAKMNLTRLRILLQELNEIKKDKEDTLAIRLKALESKFIKIQENIIEDGEEKLIECYKLNSFLKQKQLEVFQMNEDLKKKILDLKTGSSEIDECRAYEEYEMYKIELDYSVKIRDYIKTIRVLRNKNEKLEVKEDESIQCLKNQFRDRLDFYEKANEELKQNIYLDQKRLSRLKEKLESMKMNERNFDENFKLENKKYLIKLSLIENLKNCVNLKNNAIDSTLKSLSTAKLKNKKNLKINSFQLKEENFFVKTLPVLKLENENLIIALQEYEEKLVKIVTSKIRLYKILNFKSPLKYKNFQKKFFPEKHLKTKMLIKSLEKFNPSKKILITKLKRMLK
jgi:hypothetical protein